jgi:hypothetical protein
MKGRNFDIKQSLKCITGSISSSALRVMLYIDLDSLSKIADL